MKPPRVFHSASGWVIDTPVGLSPRQLDAAVAWAQRDFIRQAGRLPRGERRETLLIALGSLDSRTIKQRLVNPYSGQTRGDLFPIAPDLAGG